MFDVLWRRAVWRNSQTMKKRRSASTDWKQKTTYIMYTINFSRTSIAQWTLQKKATTKTSLCNNELPKKTAEQRPTRRHNGHADSPKFKYNTWTDGYVSTLRQFLRQPVESFVQTVTLCCACCLDVPLQKEINSSVLFLALSQEVP